MVNKIEKLFGVSEKDYPDFKSKKDKKKEFLDKFYSKENFMNPGVRSISFIAHVVIDVHELEEDLNFLKNLSEIKLLDLKYDLINKIEQKIKEIKQF